MPLARRTLTTRVHIVARRIRYRYTYMYIYVRTQDPIVAHDVVLSKYTLERGPKTVSENY